MSCSYVACREHVGDQEISDKIRFFQISINAGTLGRQERHQAMLRQIHPSFPPSASAEESGMDGQKKMLVAVAR